MISLTSEKTITYGMTRIPAEVPLFLRDYFPDGADQPVMTIAVDGGTYHMLDETNPESANERQAIDMETGEIVLVRNEMGASQ